LPGTSELTVYQRLLVALAAAAVCAQLVAFLSTNVGVPHFLTTGEPTMTSALGRLSSGPAREPVSTFLRAASRRIEAGSVMLLSVGATPLASHFRVAAAYYLFPHKVYFGRRGQVRAAVENSRRLDVLYLLLVGHRPAFRWPNVHGARVVVGESCCRLARLSQTK
jgi:hypothetical protein